MLTTHDVPTTTRVKDSRGGKLAVTQAGDLAGTAVFFLHGTPGCRIGPQPRTSVLYRHRIRLICFDRPGYGESDRFEGRLVSDGADDVKAIAEQLGIERFAVVGRSGGAPHALACAALLPEYVTRAATLVTLAPPDAKGLDWYRGMAASNVKEYEAASEGPAYLAGFLEPAADEIRKEPVRLIDSFYHELPLSDRLIVANAVIREKLTQGYAEALRTSTWGWIDDGMAFRSNWGFDPADISVPVRLWHGADDVFSPVQHTRWLANRIPAAEAVIQPNVGHFAAINALPSMLTWLSEGEHSHR